MATIVHAIVGYFFLLFVVRVLARRPGGQMTMIDFVLVFLVGGVTILETVGNDRSLTNCVCAIMAVGLMHRLVSWAKARSRKLGTLFDGTPLVVVRNGEWQEEVMQGLYVAREDVLAAGRGQGVRGLDQIGYAILERNGAITVIENDEKAGESK